MIPKGLFTQIAVVILSAGIIFTYIRPSFNEIGQTQDVIAQYQQERGKVEEVNRELSRQISVLESVSVSDQRALLTYMPDEVDRVSVTRDIKYIVDQSGAIFIDVTDEGAINTENNGSSRRGDFAASATRPTNEAYPYAFTVSLEGSYQQIKRFFELLEQSNYPLEAHQVDISVTEGGFLSAEVKLVTYAHLEPVNEQE